MERVYECVCVLVSVNGSIRLSAHLQRRAFRLPPSAFKRSLQAATPPPTLYLPKENAPYFIFTIFSFLFILLICTFIVGGGVRKRGGVPDARQTFGKTGIAATYRHAALLKLNETKYF